MQKARFARIALDLAPQPRHLHIDRALACLVHLQRRGDILTRQNLVRPRRQRCQQRRLPPGQPHHTSGTAQFPARPVKMQRPQRQWSGRRLHRCHRRRCPAQQGANAQQQLTRVERLAQVVIRPGLESGNPILWRAPRGQQQDRRLRIVAPQHLGQLQPGLTGHHHIHHDQVRLKHPQPVARIRRTLRGADPKPVLQQVARQQVTQPRVIVDNKYQRVIRHLNAARARDPHSSAHRHP